LAGGMTNAPLLPQDDSRMAQSVDMATGIRDFMSAVYRLWQPTLPLSSGRRVTSGQQASAVLRPAGNFTLLVQRKSPKKAPVKERAKEDLHRPAYRFDAFQSWRMLRLRANRLLNSASDKKSPTGRGMWPRAR
jgi:hypothetical protein